MSAGFAPLKLRESDVGGWWKVGARLSNVRRTSKRQIPVKFTGWL